MSDEGYPLSLTGSPLPVWVELLHIGELMIAMHSLKKRFRPGFFILVAGALGLLATTVAAPVVSAVSYSDPVQTAYWNYQDSSLSNPNDVGVQGADITPDGTLIVMTENKRSRIRIINSSTGAFVRTVTVGAEPWEVVINSTGSFVWVMNLWDNSISLVEIATGAVSTPITNVCEQGARGMRNMVLTPNNQYLAVSCASQWSDSGTSVKIIKLSDYSVTSVSNGSNPLIRLAMSPVGDYVYASSKWGQVTSSGTPITQIAIPSGVITSTFSVQTSAGSTTADGPSFININGDGEILYVASNNGVLSAWNNLGASPTKLWSTYLGNGALGDVGGATPFVVDRTRNLGYIVYTNVANLWPEVLDVYNLTTGSRITRFPISHQWSVSIALSDDGQTLISSGWRFSNMYKYRVGQAILSAQTVTWSPNTSLSVGSSPRTPSSLASTSGNGAITYSVVSAGATGCSVASVTGVITYSAAGNCTIRATASVTSTYLVGTTDVTFVISAPATTTTTAGPTTTTVAATTTTSSQPQGQASVATIAPSSGPTTTVLAPMRPQATTTSIPPVVTTVANAPTVVAPKAPALAPGEAGAVVDGKTIAATLSRADNQITAAAGDISTTISGLRPDGQRVALNAEGNLVLDERDKIVVEASGIEPYKDVEVWMFSTPTKLGVIAADANGKIAGTFNLPNGIESGDHRVVLSGTNPEGTGVVIGIGISYGAVDSGSSITRVLIAIPIALAILLGFFLPAVTRRRKKNAIA